MIEKNRNHLEETFSVEYIAYADAEANELYKATADVEKSLLECRDKKVNSNQITELDPSYPFIRLILKQTTTTTTIVDLTDDTSERSEQSTLMPNLTGTKRGIDSDNDSMPPLITDNDNDSDNQSDTDSLININIDSLTSIAEKGSFPTCEVANRCNHLISKKKL